MSITRRRAILVAGGCIAAACSASALRPTHRASAVFAPIQLDAQIPLSFGNWRLDRTIVPVLPDPGVQAALDKVYTQVLARTYVESQGQRVMLSIAYGAEQGNDATAAHRPEFCYSAQGFSVSSLGEQALKVDGKPLVVRRLIGTMQNRREPISYWVTLNDKAVLPGMTRKIEQIRLGLLGQIPDGMLVRVSTISGADDAGFALQDRFLADLHRTLSASLQTRYFGA